MRDALTTAIEVTGAATISVGLSLVYLPLGVIAAGGFLVGIGWLVGR